MSLLERLGVEVVFPESHTWCGQPLFNSGFQSQAREVPRHWIRVLGATEEYIVAPSGS